MRSLISVQNLSKNYGVTKALDNVSFDITSGEIVGLIGPNGAGKSTLLKSVLGLIRYEGDLTVLGQSPRHDRAQMLSALSYIADVSSLPDWISVKQLFEFMDGVHGGFDRELALEYLGRSAVTLEHKVKALSKGMKTQLHLALIMGVDTKLLVLDEPTLGLDVIFRTEFYDTLANEYFNKERTIFVTTHQVEEIEEKLTRVMFIDQGRISFDIPIAEIANNFVRVTIDASKLGDAQTMNPIHSRVSGDDHIFVFENQSVESLKHLGDVSAPRLAELFVAKVRGTNN